MRSWRRAILLERENAQHGDEVLAAGVGRHDAIANVSQQRAKPFHCVVIFGEAGKVLGSPAGGPGGRAWRDVVNQLSDFCCTEREDEVAVGRVLQIDASFLNEFSRSFRVALDDQEVQNKSVHQDFGHLDFIQFSLPILDGFLVVLFWV